MATDRDTYVVERSRHVDAPPAAVRDRVVDLHRWPEWSPWEDLDPDLAREYGGPPTGVGSWYAWQGNRKAGEGRMQIVGADDTSVTIDLRFVKPFRSQSTTELTFEPSAGGTQVTWTMRGERTLATKVMGLFTSMDKMIGPDFERGLERLRASAEAGGGAAP